MLDTIIPAGIAVSTLIFLVAASAVWSAGARLAYLADALSDRLKVSKSLIGVIILALGTSLPEVATTLAAAARQNQELVLNNLYGGVALQTAILAVSDLWARGAITNYPRRTTHMLEALLLIALLSVTLIVATFGDVAIGFVGAGSIFIAMAYAGSIWLLRSYDPEGDWRPVDLPDERDGEIPIFGKIDPERGLPRIAFETGLACLAILVFGVLLVAAAESFADATGLDQSFVGVSLLAAATSLPELTTSITAVRMGAYTMAISNIFGSNLIMLVLVFPADILFRSGPILRDISPTVSLALGFGLLVTTIYSVGLVIRRKPRLGPLGLDSLLVLFVFLISLVSYYAVSNGPSP